MRKMKIIQTDNNDEMYIEKIYDTHGKKRRASSIIKEEDLLYHINNFFNTNLGEK